MISNKPYLIRALYEWVTDSELTPYILVNATVQGCQFPQEHVTDGRIIFNIAFDVVEGLLLGNETIEFTARFSGVPTYICIPVAAVAAIYAKENGEGMAFPEEISSNAEASKTSPGTNRAKGKPNLTIVK